MRPLVVPIVVLVILGALPFSPVPAQAADFETYMGGLDWPIALEFSTDGRIFFAERNTGRIRVIEDNVLLPAPYYTLTNTLISGEQGLLGLALHPGYPTVPFIYAYHSYNDQANGTRYNRVVRLSGSGNTGSFDRVIVGAIPMGSNHNGGIIGFGPDGKLYVTTGEAGSPANAQDLTTRAGKILRANDDGTAPSDNPFFGASSGDDYIFTYGHRNVFGLAFHPTTGRVFVTENGPACNDEVNLLVRGGNFGWGPAQTCSSPPPPPWNTNRDGPSPILPIWYAGPPMVVPTNAVIYAGTQFPQYEGDLIMGDATASLLRRFDLGPPDYNTILGESTILEAPSFVLDVEVGPDGAIWFTTSTAIYRYGHSGPSPIASFTYNPSPGIVGRPITFDASASYDSDGTIISYVWDFGDGEVGEGLSPTHTYAATGTFRATLTVTDNATLSDANTQSVLVIQRGGVDDLLVGLVVILILLPMVVVFAVWLSRRRRRG